MKSCVFVFFLSIWWIMWLMTSQTMTCTYFWVSHYCRLRFCRFWAPIGRNLVYFFKKFSSNISDLIWDWIGRKNEEYYDASTY